MATEFFQGLDKVLKNLDAAEGAIVNAAARGMGKAALLTEAHIKVNYNRERTGKGFTDRSSLLRNSIGSAVVVANKDFIMGYVFAGKDYAVYVENRWSGKFAFLWPGVQDMKTKIFAILAEETRGAIR